MTQASFDLLQIAQPKGRRAEVWIAAGLLLLLPALHPLLIPLVGVPSHLLWFVHVLPVALLSYVCGSRCAVAVVALSVVGVAAGEQLFGAGYGRAADPATTLALAVAVGASGVLVAGFALAVRGGQVGRHDLQRQLGAALDASPEAVLLGGARRIRYANAAALAVLEARPDQLRGTSLDGVLGHRDAVPSPIGAAGLRPVRTVLQTLAGRPFPAEVTASPLRDAAGEPAAYLVTLRDLSARTKREQAQRRTEALAELGTVIASIAHELNNPLAAILSHAELLGRDVPLPEDVAEDLAVVAREARRAAGIARQLLGLVRRGEQPREPADLNRLVERALRARATSFAAHRIQVLAHLANGLPPVQVARGEIEQVLANLLANAEYAMHEAHGAGTLTVTTRGRGGFVQVVIVDDGPGIGPEQLPRLFEAFFTTKPVGSGTGLGLSIARRIARDHGGDLYLEPGAGPGGAFTLCLPAAAAPAAPGRSGDHLLPRPATVGPLRVLVVDDEPSIRRGIERLLTHRGHVVVTAADRRTAGAALADGALDLVLCDVHLGSDSGLEVYRDAVTRAPGLAERFVFMSGDVMSPALQEALEGSRARYLLKPFEATALLRLVEGEAPAGATPPARTAAA